MLTKTPTIIILSSFSTFLPFLTCTALFKIFKYNKNLIPLYLFFTVAVIAEIIVHIYHLFGKPNVWISHLYTLVEYVLIAYILSTWQKDDHASRVMRLSIVVYFVIYFILKLSKFENFEADTINYISRPISLLFISGAVFYTFHQFWLSTPAPLHKDFRFWILIAMAIYYSSSIIIFAFMYIKAQGLLLYLIYIHAALNILQNILFTVGIIRAFGSSSHGVSQKLGFTHQ